MITLDYWGEGESKIGQKLITQYVNAPLLVPFVFILLLLYTQMFLIP